MQTFPQIDQTRCGYSSGNIFLVSPRKKTHPGHAGMGFPIKMWPYLVLLQLESDLESRCSKDAEVVAVGIQVAQTFLGFDQAAVVSIG